MSTNQLNDISQVYLSQIAEETPGERIDRISKENVAKSKAKADADIAVRNKKTEEYQKHKQSVLAKGGRPVDALDSWHKKQAHKEAYELVEQSAAQDQQVRNMKRVSESRLDKDPPSQFEKGDDDRGNPAYMKTSSMKDEEKWERLQNMRRKSKKAKVRAKAESFSNWRNDLREIVAEPEEKAEKEVTEKKVKNKVVINPSFQEAINDIGGEVLDAVELDEVKVTKLDDKKKKEERDKKVKTMLARQAEWESGKKKALHASHEPEGENLDEKDSYKTVAAVIDYDRAKKGSKDATYDSDHGKKKAAKKERDYAAWEREKMKRDDPNWKHKKYHTGMHGESVEVDEYIEVIGKVKKSELEADLKRWGFEEVDEAVKGQDTQDRKDAAADRRAGKDKLLSKKTGESYAKWTMAKDKWVKRKKGEIDESLEDTKKKANVEEQLENSKSEHEDPGLKAKLKKTHQLKKQVLIKKLQAVRQGGEGITASYEPEGEVIDETLTSVKAASFGMPHKERKELIDKYKKNELKKGKQPVKAPIQKEDAAFQNVVSMLQKKHGKAGVITKDNPPKPPTPAEREASKKHREKINSQRKKQSMSDVVRSYRRAGESD